ncbi:hypothetical protein TRICI_005633 [Trichomonascus ciferrii]|uniref:Uncharacterized protein n=1 Tax=Trichomonascus ciferrii TaxID=44093 RepID=A0A642UQW6_9ASCO|nr:hypothetical protein TRICI_005633 [Trichomonascus ciferrii]
MVPSVLLIEIKVQSNGTLYTIHELTMTEFTSGKDGPTTYVLSANSVEINVDSPKGFQSIVSAFNLSIISCLRLKVTSATTFTELL